ncbi:hypothetical protein BAE44_0010489 [Dichanthelium oligosanthes]|uniref:Late embryogenesis abundant protein LEA-2 subgroup domain-containing protein n=1 Tax=Dichanthelium oligosanthes TaxID=888268 RepID=A0A1E5VTP5_9POAL|nr:hypothetical protein BAE44_0010489 [Dichanthelium oligosanthes]
MDEGRCEKCFTVGIFDVLFVIAMFLTGAGTLYDPVYRVTIDSVAGLNPATDLARPTLKPEFNLTVRIDPGLWGGGDACLDVGSAVAVSYHRVPLAAAAVVSRRCADPGRSAVPIVARGSGVRVPWAVLDALASDMWWGFSAGAAKFDVTLTVPCEGRWKVVSCRARAGGVAALQEPCKVSLVGTVEEEPQQVAAA